MEQTQKRVRSIANKEPDAPIAQEEKEARIRHCSRFRCWFSKHPCHLCKKRKECDIHKEMKEITKHTMDILKHEIKFANRSFIVSSPHSPLQPLKGHSQVSEEK